MAVSRLPNIIIQSHRGPYTVRFGPPFAGLGTEQRERDHLIVDARVAELYESQLAPALAGRSVLRIEATETNKSLERFSDYVIHLIEHGVQRGHLLTAVGGGIIQDITAFLAATLLRGLRWRFYPTTLLAQADSCIGSKSSVNVGQYKNQLGTFNPPEEILISIDVLGTLNERDIRSGIGEMIKVHTIAGLSDVHAIKDDYELMLKDKRVLGHYIRRSLELKKIKIEADEFDQGERLVMNYGHSFGHAIESATSYTIPHGIAVTIGMDLANYMSWRFGFVSQEVYEDLHSLLAENYAGFEGTPIPESRFFESLAKDKKNIGVELTLILMKGPGRVFRDKYPNDEKLRAICREYLEALPVSRTSHRVRG